MGTGEIVHIISYKALPGKVEEFEEKVQEIGNFLYNFSANRFLKPLTKTKKQLEVCTVSRRVSRMFVCAIHHVVKCVLYSRFWADLISINSRLVRKSSRRKKCSELDRLAIPRVQRKVSLWQEHSCPHVTRSLLFSISWRRTSSDPLTRITMFVTYPEL